MKAVIDKDIPFIKGRLEQAGFSTLYVGQWDFTPELVKDADALLIRTRTLCDRNLLEGSKVRLIATGTIGMDQIDCEWCAAQGISVRNAPGCNAPAVAQYVWSSLLRLWGFEANDIYGKTLGVIGCGNIGSIVKEWGERLGVNVLVSDPPKGMDYPLERLLNESDAVTLHTPLTHAGEHPTHHLIGERELSLMKPGAILVNAARGAVVDFSALKPAVMSGRIRAVIDTWEGEPEVDAELLDKVEYGTFHIAGYSLEGKQRATRMVLEAVDETFGVNTDKSGLEGPYRGVDNITAAKIIDSYDPAVDTALLRQQSGSFDRLRNEYKLRHEVR